MTDIEMLLESDINLTDFSEEEDVVKVKGFLCHEGIMNRQTFTKEKIEKAAPSFVGAPITTRHSSGIDVVVGGLDLSECRFDETINKKTGKPINKYGMYFEGRIGSEYTNIVNNLRRGFLNKLSMRIGPNQQPSHFCNICGEPIGKCKHDFSDPDFNPVVNDFYGKHVAIVTEPADRDTSITMSFSDGTTEELNLKDYIRRTKMSDFEEKYNKLFDEHKALETEKAELETSFAEEKQKLEDSISEKAAQYSELKTDFDELQTSYDELKEKAQQLSDEFEKIQEEKLSGLRAQVTELNTEMKGILKEEDINSFSESTLNFWIEQYETQKKNIETAPVKKPLNATNQYSENKPEGNADPIESLLDFVNQL
jgi:hypothetical protein